MSDTVLDGELHERWADSSAGDEARERALAEVEVRRAHDDGGAVARSHLGRALQRASEACRLSGALDEALVYKDEALEIWRAQDKFRAVFLVELQRALVLAELGAAEEAAAQMRRLEDLLRGDERLEPFYLDFWLEYDARRAAMANDCATARARLEAALAYRKEHRAARIVEWTEAAIMALRADDDRV